MPLTDVEIASKLAEHENRIKVNEHRVTDLETKTDKLEALTMSVQKLAISVEQMTKDLSESKATQSKLADRILQVEQGPTKDKAKKHDEIVDLVTKCLVSAVVGALIAYLGLS